jgi:hypothetical protein
MPQCIRIASARSVPANATRGMVWAWITVRTGYWTTGRMRIAPNRVPEAVLLHLKINGMLTVVKLGSVK